MAIYHFFQYGTCPPSWICHARFWTTNEEYFVFFIAVQNFIWIGAVVLIIWTILDFAHLVWKCLFVPPKLAFSEYFTPKWGGISTNSQKAHLGQKDVIWRIDRRDRSTDATCVHDETRKTKKEIWCGAKLDIRRDHPRRRIEMKCAWWVVFGTSSLVWISSKSVKRFWSCGGEICPFLLIRPMAYTTACTIIRAVICLMVLFPRWMSGTLPVCLGQKLIMAVLANWW